jgi:hypothetical protein
MNRYLRAAMNMPAQLPEPEEEVSPNPNPYVKEGGTEPPAAGSVADGGPWGTIVRAWEEPEPPWRAWVLPGRVPEGATTILYGDAGTLKSWTAIHIALCVATGAPWLGQPVVASPVMYVDAELDKEEFMRRAYDVARGLGLPRPPEGLHYLRLKRSLAEPTTIDVLAPRLEALGLGLVVLDSLSVACSGADLERPAAMTDVMQRLRAWGTVLALDHIPKPQAGVNPSGLRPFGSQFKYAIARSVLQMHTAESGQALVIRQTKSNFGARQGPLALGVRFAPEAVTVEALAADAAELAGVEEQLPALERVARALAEAAGGVAYVELAGDLGLTAKTVQNYLSVLRQQGRAEPLGEGRWRATPGPIPNPKGIGIGIGNPADHGRPALDGSAVQEIPCHDCGAPLPEGSWHLCPPCLARVRQN